MDVLLLRSLLMVALPVMAIASAWHGIRAMKAGRWLLAGATGLCFVGAVMALAVLFP